MKTLHVVVLCFFGLVLIILLLGIGLTLNSFTASFRSSETAFGSFMVFLLTFLQWGLIVCAVLAGLWGASHIYARIHWAHYRELTPTAEGNYPALVSPRRTMVIEAGNGPVPSSYHYHQQIENNAPKGIAAPATTITEEPSIPGPCDLLDLVDIWTPKPNRLLLALDSQGLVSVPLQESYHLALAGPTGGGKSNTLRLLMMQLVMFHPTYFINPAYAPMKADGTDWRPIGERLAAEPARKANEIKYTFEWLLAELERREDAEQSGDMSWAQKPIYVVIDEAKEVFARFPDGPQYVCAILRRARQYKIFIILAAQDMLIKNIGGDSGARECYRTSYYFGGDPTTARALLDIKGAVDETGLGVKGLVLLKPMTNPKPIISRVPLVSNEALYAFMETRGGGYRRDYQSPVDPFEDDFRDYRQPRPFDRENYSHPIVTGGLVSNGKPLQEPMEDLPKAYRFTVDERPVVVELYKALGSIDKVLRQMKKSNRYHADASRIVKEEGL